MLRTLSSSWADPPHFVGPDSSNCLPPLPWGLPKAAPAAGNPPNVVLGPRTALAAPRTQAQACSMPRSQSFCPPPGSRTEFPSTGQPWTQERHVCCCNRVESCHFLLVMPFPPTQCLSAFQRACSSSTHPHSITRGSGDGQF